MSILRLDRYEKVDIRAMLELRYNFADRRPLLCGRSMGFIAGTIANKGGDFRMAINCVREAMAGQKGLCAPAAEHQGNGPAPGIAFSSVSEAVAEVFASSAMKVLRSLKKLELFAVLAIASAVHL